MTNTEKERRTEEALKLSSLFEELDGRRPRLFMIALSQTLAMIGRDDILIAAHQVSKDDKELLFRYGILAAFDKNTDVSDVSLTMLRVLVSMAKEEQNPTEEMPY